MGFHSSVFLFAFLPIVLTLAPIVPRRASNVFLLIISLLFYAWGEPVLVTALLASIAVNHCLGLVIGRACSSGVRKGFLSLGIVANLVLLSTFKYADFFTGCLNSLLGAFGLNALPLPLLVWPVGVSFFTFQAITYLVDIYRKKAPAQRNPVDTALYISFFPKLLAGPIAQYGKIANQLHERNPTAAKFASGARRFVIGLAKKVLIANPLARASDGVFDLLPAEVGAGLAWLGAICFTLQIYFDFAGYTDMAIGLGQMLGFELPENFRHPYISRSIREFWRRWHITLSNWFRDYLYIPLGGNRKSGARTYLNLVLVFFLCGLWHGPAWTFVIWGLYHGLFMVVERAGLERFLEKHRAVSHVYTLLIVAVGWVFFRADSLGSAWIMVRSMFGGSLPANVLHPASEFLDGEVLAIMIFAIFASTPVFEKLGDRIQKSKLFEENVLGESFRLAMTMILFVICFLAVAGSTHNPFIYTKF